MNKGGRPRLTEGEKAWRFNISVPADIAREADAAKIEMSAVCTAAIVRKLADKVYLDAAKDVFAKAVHGIESKLDKAGTLGPEDRLAFAQIRAVFWAIEGDAWLPRVKLEAIKKYNFEENSDNDGKLIVKPINGGGEDERIPLSERK